MPKHAAQRHHRSLGQSFVEFALVLPVVLLLLAIAADFGRLFYAYVAVVNAAKEGAAYGATNPICVDDSRGICEGTNNVEARVALEAGSLAGGVSTSLIQCLDPAGDARDDISQCSDGDTYVVRAAHTFTFLTPIIGPVLGDSLLVESESHARVLNLAFDPTPGASVTKEACDGAGCTDLALTPITDEGNVPQYLEVDSGDTVTYRITVKNIGGETLTSATISDSRSALVGCPVPASLAVGATWSCEYERDLFYVGGPSEETSRLSSNTVTVDADQILPRQGEAVVAVTAGTACEDSLLAVPKLIGLTKSAAETEWTDAGFTGTFVSWNGQPTATVATQSLEEYSCAAANSSITVAR